MSRVRKSVLGGCHSCRVRRPKTIAHDNAIDASYVSSPHSVQDREVDVLMYPGQLAVRAIAITNLSAAACTFAICFDQVDSVLTPVAGPILLSNFFLEFSAFLNSRHSPFLVGVENAENSKLF